MSNYTQRSAYTEQEYADIIQCYINSGKEIKITQMYYINKYPTRRRPSLYILNKIVREYFNNVASSTSDLDSKQTYSDPDKDNRIFNYLLENCDATILKAAIIFKVKSSYIQKLLKERKVEILQNKVHNREKPKRQNLNNKRVLKEIEEASHKSELTTTSIADVISMSNLTKHRLDFIKKEKQNEMRTENGDEFAIDIHDDFAQITIELENGLRDFNNKKISVQMEKKKRKKRTANSEANEIAKYVARKKRKKNIQDQETAGQEHVNNPFVYTTRLEEMNILRNGLNNFDTIYIFSEILRESKPTYKNIFNRKSITRNKNSFKTLQKVLQMLSNKSHTSPINNFKPFATTNSEANDNFKMSQIYEPDDKILNVLRTHGAVIIINNLYLKNSDVYVTDSEGKVSEYYTIKFEAQDILKTIDQFKNRITLDSCCWYYRQEKIDLLFPNTSYSFSRFLKTKHDCCQALCTCCCNPTLKVINSVPNYKKTIFKRGNKDHCELEPRDSNKKLKKAEDNLITKAYNYCNNSDEIIPIEQNVRHFSSISYKPISNANILTKFRFKEKMQGNSVKSFCEYYEIGLDQNIIYHSMYITQTTNQSFHPKYKGIHFSNSRDVYDLSVCCKSRRDKFLLCKYKKAMLSANSLRYLKVPITPNICDVCEKRDFKLIENIELEIKLPEINHTRQLIRPTFFQIDTKGNYFEVQNKTVDHLPNIVNNESKKVLFGFKNPDQDTRDARDTPIKKIKLIVNCMQLPTYKIIMTNVEYDLAAQLIIEFSSMSVSIQQNKKVLVTLNSDMTTLSMNVYNILAGIFSGIQTIVYKSDLPIDTKLNLFGRIETDNQMGPISCNILQDKPDPIIDVTKIYYEYNKSGDCEAQTTVYKQSTNSNAILKSLLTKKSDDRQNVNPPSFNNKITDTYVYISDNSNHELNPVSDNDTLEESETDVYNIVHRNNNNTAEISSEVKDKVDELDCTVTATNVENIRKIFIEDTSDTYIVKHPSHTYQIRELQSSAYNRFSELQRYHKKCYTMSFQSYLKYKRQDEQTVDTVTPKISNVFSLRATDTDKTPSSLMENQNNNIIFNDSESHKPSTSQTPMQSLVMNQDDNGILNPITNKGNIISQPAMTIYQQQCEPKQLRASIPDLIKDIPEGSDDTINISDEISVQEEDEIVILDSD